MILIDNQGHDHTELIPHINNQHVPVMEQRLEWGDACFTGNGPDGHILVGVERKRLHDMVACIETKRYGAKQRVGMRDLYGLSVLIIEGDWRPHDSGGFLMEGFQGGISWGYFNHRKQKIMYNMLRRYLFSVSLSGVMVIYTKSPFHTAFDICELFHYFQKPWASHTSLLEMEQIQLPTLGSKPGLARMWAACIEGIGTKLSSAAERLFGRSPVRLANSDEMEWLKIPGVGVPTAKSIVSQIWGRGK